MHKRRSHAYAALLIAVLTAPGCWRQRSQSSAAPIAAPAVPIDPCMLALVPHHGETSIDRQIAGTQERVRAAGDPYPVLERLGWLFVAKARRSADPGYYRLAEACALCMEAKRPDAPDHLLLRGHVLHNLHRFGEAETLARRLTALRESPFDQGLLGDTLLEQGKLGEAAEAYQRMLDLKPGLQSYSRGAHLRWLKGDLSGAVALMRLAARAGAGDAEPAAWVYSRLALLELQSGEVAEADKSCRAALELQDDHAAALLVSGRVLLAQGRLHEAIERLERAARLNPLPEPQWTFAEALRSAGRIEEALRVESDLIARGEAADPRTLALFLATRGKEARRAVRLAEEELRNRADVLTQDALAWSLFAEGRPADARAPMERALSEGTEDARLYLHAGVIAAGLGRADEARGWLEKARRIEQMLLPSEKELLSKTLSAF